MNTCSEAQILNSPKIVKNLANLPIATAHDSRCYFFQILDLYLKMKNMITDLKKMLY